MIPMTSNVGFAARPIRPASFAMAAKRGSDRMIGGLELCAGNPEMYQTRIVRTGENLFLQGDELHSIYVLRDGWAFRYQCLEDGRRQIVDFVLPGDALGISPSPQVAYGVEALSHCTWAVISRERFFAILSGQPALSMKLLGMISNSQARAFGQLTSIGRRTARERVAYLLFELARRVQNSASGYEGVEITMPLMLSHIGDALGLATETVCRCLGELRRAGILVFSAGRLEILDLDGLSDLVGVLVEHEESGTNSRNRKRLVA